MKNKMPSADEFPITFEHALRLAVGGRSVPDRFHTWRQWWKSELARVAKATGVLTDNTGQMVAYFRLNGVDQSWLHCFGVGIAAFKSLQGVEQRRNAALTRWGSRKNRVAGPESNAPHRYEPPAA